MLSSEVSSAALLRNLAPSQQPAMCRQKQNYLPSHRLCTHRVAKIDRDRLTCGFLCYSVSPCLSKETCSLKIRDSDVFYQIPMGKLESILCIPNILVLTVEIHTENSHCFAKLPNDPPWPGLPWQSISWSGPCCAPAMLDALRFTGLGMWV